MIKRDQDQMSTGKVGSFSNARISGHVSGSSAARQSMTSIEASASDVSAASLSISSSGPLATTRPETIAGCPLSFALRRSSRAGVFHKAFSKPGCSHLTEQRRAANQRLGGHNRFNPFWVQSASAKFHL